MSHYYVCLEEKITGGCFYLNYMAQDSFTSVFLPSIASSVNQVSKACLCLCGDLQSGVGRWTIAHGTGWNNTSFGVPSTQTCDSISPCLC